MNILFTCAGRRNYLLDYFRDVMGDRGKIVTADMDLTAPAMAVADKAIVVPGVYSKNYVDIIIEICKKEKINALFPLNDLELPVLATERNRFDELGTNLIVSNENVINTCNDKNETVSFCKENNINTPITFLDYENALAALERGIIQLPLVVKPRWGSASIGIEFPQDLEELELAYRIVKIKISNSILYEASKKHLDKAVIIQEKIIGTEYGLDILNDLKGNTVQVYVKEKLAMRAGETDKAVLRYNSDLEDLGYRIGNALGHIGNLDCDIFVNNNGYYLLEMNPRFGGGYPFSHMAGAEYPAAICEWIEGRPYSFANSRKKYDQPYAKCDTIIRVLGD